MNLPQGPPLPFKASPDDLQTLRGVGVLDLLDSDPRPSFILDTVSAKASYDSSILPVYWNPAIATTNNENLLHALVGVVGANGIHSEERKLYASNPFRIWLLNQEATRTPFVHCDYNWMKVRVASRWNVISGLPIDTIKSLERAEAKGSDPTKQVAKKTVVTLDWTSEIPPERLSTYLAWARSIDWSRTSLGPMRSWSSELRGIANLMMRDPRPSVLFYGPDLTMMYNEAYAEPLGGIHPCMGVSARDALASIWTEQFEPIAIRNIAGETVEKTNMAVPIVRSGFVEEAYFSMRFIPLLDAEGLPVGHYQSLVETTKGVISQRHSETLVGLSEELPCACDIDSYWTLATEILSRNDKDIPFALLYSVDVEENTSNFSATSHSDLDQQCTLRGSFGVHEGSPARPAHLDLKEDHGFSPYFRQAMLTGKPIIVQLEHGSPAAGLVQGTQWRGFGDPCRAAAICPIVRTPSGGVKVLGFVVIGLNPRRPYDNDYQHFTLVSIRLLSVSLTAILLHDKDIKNQQSALANAEAMKLVLELQLLEVQKVADWNAFKFKRFAERSDIGIFIIGMDGVYTYRNAAWYSILAPVDRDIDLDVAWTSLIDDATSSTGKLKFQTLIETKQRQSFELKLKRTWNAPSQEDNDTTLQEQPMWVLCSIFPELTEGGGVHEMVGTITDISQQKWAEKVQATQVSRAEESKRQLENFIDTTSHEMRNPLSAILQCADSIIFNQRDLEKSVEYRVGCSKVLDATLDAAETIVQCSKHMKTIVDDVLTTSKLDSGLFVMTPVEVQLESIARDAVKMFEGEARSAGVELVLHIEESCKQDGVDNISLDPTRVLQVLINLITNAIKFTRLEQTRQISIGLGISFEQPLHNADGHVSFIRGPETSEAKSLQEDWEEGEIVYIIFSVQDTGRGLSDAEHEFLFNRFSQASPRTQIDYGGSGLGLFISRRLTEMHGGAIGFSSKAGVGSTFSFYVKSRKGKPTSELHSLSMATAGRGLWGQEMVLPNHPNNEEDEALHETATKAEIDFNELYVLIVEDNLVNQRVLAKQLRNLGVRVAVANHGGEALEYLRSTNYYSTNGSPERTNILSLILMDWEMPIMDGLTCVRNIRQLQTEGIIQGHVPVIAVTANVRSEQVAIAMEAGMDNLISKPFRIPELLACIEETL